MQPPHPILFCLPTAVVRVRPAFAGEGRYFVRVPDGTNSGRFLFDDGNNKKDQIPMEQALEEVPTPDAVEDARVGLGGLSRSV